MALKYAKLFPELVSKLFIVSITPAVQSAINKNFLGRLFFGLKSLSNKPGIFRYIAWQFRKYYADERTVRPILQKIHRASKFDFDLIEGKSGIDPIYPCFVELFQKSIAGIADDFEFALADVEKIVKDMKTETTFIHGLKDPMIEPSIVENFAKVMKNVKIKIIQTAGHHIFNTHSEKLWTIIQGD